MRVKDLIFEVEDVKSEGKLRLVLADMFDIIEKFENGKAIDSKSDKDRIEYLKDVISTMIKDDEQKAIIKGES